MAVRNPVHVWKVPLKGRHRPVIVDPITGGEARVAGVATVRRVSVEEFEQSQRAHDVVADYAGWDQSIPRLTCRTEGCDEATLLRHRWMTAEQWAAEVKKFRAAHPWRAQGRA